MRIFSILALGSALAIASPSLAADFTFAGPLNIPGSGIAGPASVFPINFAVSGLTTVSDVNITFHGLTHSFSDDLVMALVSPTNTAILFLDNAGGSANWSSSTLTIDQQAAAALTNGGGAYGGNNGIIPSGSYKPSVYGLGVLLGLALNGTNLDQFNGQNANGNWKLYIADNGILDSGKIDSVTLSIASAPAVPEPATWGMMIGGFALAGAAMRRRSWRVATA